MAQSHVGRSQVICADIPPIRFSVSRQVIHCAINLIALQLGGWATGTGGERWRGGGGNHVTAGMRLVFLARWYSGCYARRRWRR